MLQYGMPIQIPDLFADNLSTHHATAEGLLPGVALPYLRYSGPDNPADPVSLQALLHAYRSEVVLRYATWVARQIAPPEPLLPAVFEELRLRLPGLHYDEDEGLPSDEPLFTDLFARLQRWRTLILLGPSGSGKTTVIQRLAYDLAMAGLTSDAQAHLPILIDLSTCVPDRDGPGRIHDALAQAAILDLDGAVFPLEAHRRLAEVFPNVLAHPPAAAFAGIRLALLWDGLDEAAYTTLGKNGALIEAVHDAAYGRIISLVAAHSRYYLHRVAFAPPELYVATKQAAILPAGAPEIFEQAIGRLGETRGRALTSLLAQPEHAPAAELARSPLLLALLCEVYAATEALPESSGRLLHDTIAARLAVLLEPMAAARLMLALAHTAFELTACIGYGSAAPRAWFAGRLRAAAPEIDPEQALLLAWRAGILAIVQSGSMIRFAHVLFQEYFAALALHDLLSGVQFPVPDPTTPARIKRPPEPDWPRAWRAPLLLLVSLLDTQHELRPVLRDLLRDDPLSAARVLVSGASAPEPEQRTLVTSLALEHLADAGATLTKRLESGAALGHVGDPRTPVSIAAWRAELERRTASFGASAGYWCAVQPGRYRIGGWQAGQGEALIELAGFWMARFPITAAQFAAFVRTGYHTAAQRWWTPTG